MKLPPRVRATAKLYEMEVDSGFLLMFKTRENAHLYTKSSTAPYVEASAAKKVKKRAGKGAIKKAPAPSAKASTKGKRKKGASAAVKKMQTNASSSSSVAPAAAVPMTKKQSKVAVRLAREGSQSHRWEFADDNGGWSPYEGEASKLVEMEYQSWLQQPSVFVRSVHSGFFHYSVSTRWSRRTSSTTPGASARSAALL